MAYVDAFVVPVPADKKEAYLRKAEKWAPMFKEYGALSIVESWGDDIKRGQLTDFYMAVKAEEGETVALSCTTWPSKEARDAAWAKIMADERMKPDGEMPFDGKRMFSGGFATLLQA